LLQRLFGNDEREEFAFGDLQRGKGADLAIIEITIAPDVELDGQVHPVAHELDVAMDGLARDLYLRGQRRGIRELARLQRLVNAQHPLQRRARVQQQIVRHIILKLRRPKLEPHANAGNAEAEKNNDGRLLRSS
jgi:hypothetical protein